MIILIIDKEHEPITLLLENMMNPEHYHTTHHVISSYSK